MATTYKFASNFSRRFVSTKLLSVYDTFAEPPHTVRLSDKKTAMNCLLITLEGEGIVKNKQQKTQILKKNSVYFGNINNLDCLYCKQRWHYLCVWYESFGKEFPFDTYYVIDDLDAEKEQKEIHEMMSLLLTVQESAIDQANAQFTYKLIALLNKIERYKVITTTSFEKMLVYINQHLQENLTIDEIADQFGYSKKHIHYLFKQKMNISPGAFINKMKLERICGLLLTNSYTLSELAEMFGYSSSSHLIYNFKKEYGCTPKQFQMENSAY